MNTENKICGVVIFVLTLGLFCNVAQGQDQATVVAAADRIIGRVAGTFPKSAPGCAVGISLAGRPIYERAFGLAELEHGIPNTPQTIFESGSVAKQFTAAAIVALSLDGKLGLDDPVKKYITEIPDYGAPLTIRHLLNHTGGVRDWGAVLELTGFGRGDRVISQALALDVIARQKALDFTPGTEFSYTNSGYNLLAEIVERVSKKSLPAFTEERFFKPLEMTHTTWRDDYQRLVPGRAQAYSGPALGPWRLSMPFMNVYGNGGMLTTVGDWLKWNQMLDTRSLGAPLVEALETTGVLKDGKKITYALGLMVTNENGLRKVAHGGATAGYQTLLSRYPERKLSVAVMCNAAFNAQNLEQVIVREIFGRPPMPPPDAIALKPDELQKYVGLWREEKTRIPMRTSVENGVLRFAGQLALRPLSDGSFVGGPLRLNFKLDADGKPIAVEGSSPDGERRWIAETQWTPTADELKAFAGLWHSDEADASFTIAVEDGQALLGKRPSIRRPLRPQYKDHFIPGNGNGQVIWFTRDSRGQVATMHFGLSRMRDMPFERSVAK